MVNYESEWYADDSLSKWNELDVFYQKKREEKRQSILDELTKAGITRPNEKEYACGILDKNFKSKMDEWQIEKEHRIKPSLWWNEVATAQAAQTALTTTDDNQPVLAKLSANGKAWHLHPVGMVTFSVPFGITVTMLKQIFTSVPQSRQDLLQFMVDDINTHMEEYKLDTPLRLSHFFAQVKQEAGPSLKIVEDFTYSVDGLKRIYRYFGNNPKKAEKYGYPNGGKKFISQENQQIIANFAMGDRKDLGNLGSNTDDGWNFRGRGLKQLTGRSNYTDFNNGYPEIWSDEAVDFVNNPDLLHTNYKYIVRSGVFFWLSHEIYNVADEGGTAEVVDKITKIINEKTDSYPNRRNNFKEIYHDKKIFFTL